MTTHEGSTIKRVIQAGVNAIGYEVLAHKSPERKIFEALLRLTPSNYVLPTAASETLEFLTYCAQRIDQAHGQFLQDLFVLYESRAAPAFASGGYFVEFGALDGLLNSNTYLLESKYGWRGILAEPARRCHAALKRNRTCAIDLRCVWSHSGESLEFNETAEPEYSGIKALANFDRHDRRRRGGEHYQVETVSLADLLEQHQAPREIDYLSIDTEGADFAILSGFMAAPNGYTARIITIEHNFTPARAAIHSLLTMAGYVQRFKAFEVFDAWYVKQ